MKYSPRQYAQAIYAALEREKEKQRPESWKKILLILRRNGDMNKLPAILRSFEKVYLEEEGLQKVEIETVSPLGSDLEKEIKNVLGKKLLLNKKINPKLLAGLTIMINDEILIDGSAKRRLDRIFAAKKLF